MNDDKSEQDDVQQYTHSESPSNEWLKLDMLGLSVIKNIVTLCPPDERLIIMMSKATTFDYIVPNDRDPWKEPRQWKNQNWHSQYTTEQDRVDFIRKEWVRHIKTVKGGTNINLDIEMISTYRFELLQGS